MDDEERAALEEGAQRIEAAQQFDPHEVLPQHESDGWLECYHNRFDGMLWHYCGAETVRGIFDKKEIWATDMRFSNDSQEFQFGMGHAREALMQAEKASASSDQRRRVEDLRNALHSQGADATAFVFCLSQLEDNLSQWRGYCPSGGYAIGFEVRRLKFYASRAGFRLARCIYGDSECSALMRRMVRESLVRLEHFDSKGVAGDEGGHRAKAYELAEKEAKSIMAIVATLKSHKFRGEWEWRLVSEPEQLPEYDAPTGIQIRVKRHSLIPYRVIDIQQPEFPKDIDLGDLDPRMVRMMYWPACGMRFAPGMDPELSRLTIQIVYRRLPFLLELVQWDRSYVTWRRDIV